MAAARMYSEADSSRGGSGNMAVAQRLVLGATVIIGTDAPTAGTP
jgi:hypothetical protein